MKLKDNRVFCTLVFLLLLITWHTPFIAPLKLLVVFLHELSHAIATWLTGGQVKAFVVSTQQSGYVTSIGGSRFIILSSGYLGSLLFGLLFYRLSFLNQRLNLVLILLAALLLYVGVFFASTLYTTLFSIALAAVLIGLYRYAVLWVKQLTLLVFSCASMIYVPIDIWQDTIVYSGALSDARMMAQEFGGMTLLWGSLWLCISLYFIYLNFRTNR